MLCTVSVIIIMYLLITILFEHHMELIDYYLHRYSQPMSDVDAFFSPFRLQLVPHL